MSKLEELSIDCDYCGKNGRATQMLGFHNKYALSGGWQKMHKKGYILCPQCAQEVINDLPMGATWDTVFDIGIITLWEEKPSKVMKAEARYMYELLKQAYHELSNLGLPRHEAICAEIHALLKRINDKEDS